MMDFASNPREETTCVSPDAPVGAGPMFTLAMSKKTTGYGTTRIKCSYKKHKFIWMPEITGILPE